MLVQTNTDVFREKVPEVISKNIKPMESLYIWVEAKARWNLLWPLTSCGNLWNHTLCTWELCSQYHIYLREGSAGLVYLMLALGDYVSSWQV